MLIDIATGDSGSASLFVIAAAVALDGIAGGVGRGRWPFVLSPNRLTSRWAAWAAGRLNRPQRGAGSLVVRGFLVLAVVLMAWFALGWAVAAVSVAWLGWLLAVAFAAAQLDSRGGAAFGRAMIAGFSSGDLARVRAAAEPVAGAAARTSDGGTLARAAIGALGLPLATGLAAPVFWFVLLGLPGMAAYAASAVLARSFAPLGPPLTPFGFAAARLHDALALIPAALAAVAIGVAALLVPGARPGYAARALIKGPPRSAALAAGWIDEVMAAALAPSWSVVSPDIRTYARGIVSALFLVNLVVGTTAAVALVVALFFAGD